MLLYNNSFIFRPSAGIISQAYDDSQADAQHKIPVHIVLTDVNQHGPVVRFGEHQTEQPDAQVGGFKTTQNDEHELGSSDKSIAHNKSGVSNSGIKHGHVQNPLSLRSNVNSKTSAAQNEHHHVKLTGYVQGSNSEGSLNNSYTEQNQQFDKTEKKDVPQKTNIEFNDKVKPPNAEENVSKQQSLSTEEYLPENKIKKKETLLTDFQASNIGTESSSRKAVQFSSNRQPTDLLENPILTYLSKRQSLNADTNNPGTVSTNNKADTPQNIRREVFHQQTIINPNPYLYQYLQQQQHQTQQTNPVYYQMQYPVAQQQVNSQSSTQFFRYPGEAEPLGNMPQRINFFQEQNNQNSALLNRAEVSHISSISENSGNFVTTLNLNPAMAPVMHTIPTTGFTDTSSIPPQFNLPYMQSFTQPLFRGVSLPLNLPNSRLTYNGPQPSSRLQWPLAGYFPIVIRDPFLTMYNVLTNMIEYGPEADVCKKSKNFRQGRSRSLVPDEEESIMKSDESIIGKVLTMESGGWREVGENGNPISVERKMTDYVTGKEKDENSDEKGDEERKKKNGNETQSTEVIMETGGNGNAGPYITRLMVRKGGVSIAGPGGIATAGSGGTAIVGPGGVAYTSPSGLAVVGPGGKVVGLPAGTDLSATANSKSEGSTPRLLNIPPGGKIVAMGPVVYFHPPE
jgi:hypothetical protein